MWTQTLSITMCFTKSYGRMEGPVSKFVLALYFLCDFVLSYFLHIHISLSSKKKSNGTLFFMNSPAKSFLKRLIFYIKYYITKYFLKIFLTL